jgi:filamentous hemagglutinin
MNSVRSQNGVVVRTTTTLSVDQLSVALANGQPVIVGVPAGTGNHFIIVDSLKTIDNISYYMTRDPFVGPRGVIRYFD